jgi:uncharacterized membrane protein
MASLYVWLRFIHLVGVGAFLFGHGISGGASLALRARPAAEVSRALLQLSIWSYRISYPGLILVIATGVWMGFAGSWWGRGWIWASIAVLVVLFGLMSFVSVPYHRARDSAKEDESALVQRLDRTRPLMAVWIGAIGILALFFLMVFKPF